MEKLYTKEEYAQLAQEASAEGKTVYKVRVFAEANPDGDKYPVSESLDKQYPGYYVCIEENITDGTLNPDFEQEQAEKAKLIRIREIKALLDVVDQKSVRPLRAGETDRLAQLEAQAVELREELAELL